MRVRKITDLRSASTIMKTTLSKGAETGVVPCISLICKACVGDVPRRPRKKPTKQMETPNGINRFATSKSKICCIGAILKLQFL